MKQIQSSIRYTLCFSCSFDYFVLIDIHSVSIFDQTVCRDLEGRYGLYHTFPISNLTSMGIFGFFHKSHFPNKESHLGFSFLFCLPFKNKTKISGNSKSFSKKNESFSNKKRVCHRVEAHERKCGVHRYLTFDKGKSF